MLTETESKANSNHEQPHTTAAATTAHTRARRTRSGQAIHDTARPRPMEAHDHDHRVARTQSQEDRWLDEAIAASAALAAASPPPLPPPPPVGHTMPVTPSDEDRQLAAACAASEDSHAAELAASRARITATVAGLLPIRITQLVLRYWETKGEAMPAADLRRLYDVEHEEELPVGQSVKSLLTDIAELEVFSPPDKTHILIQLREQPPLRHRHRRRQPAADQNPFEEAFRRAARPPTPPAAGGGWVVVPAPHEDPRHKTTLCSHWTASGACPYGTRCMYAHGQADLRQPSPPHSPPKAGPRMAAVAPASIASGGARARAAGTAHVFVDYSNLWWGSGAKDEGKTLSIGALDELLRGVRALGECSLVVGSKPHPDHPIWDEWVALGYAVKLEPVKQGETNRRAGGGGESLVDDALHGAIYHEIGRRRVEPAASQTLVLVTGDGKDNGHRSNFPDCCQAALDKGWRVEVYGWDGGMAGSFRRLEASSGGMMAVNSLDRHRAALVVLPSSRPARAPESRSPAHSPPRGRRTLPRTPSPGCGGGSHAPAPGKGDVMAYCKANHAAWVAFVEAAAAATGRQPTYDPALHDEATRRQFWEAGRAGGGVGGGGGGWGPCKFGARCTRPDCNFGHPAAPACAAAAGGLTDGQLMSGQFRAGGRWKPCQVVSALPIIRMGGHVLVQFDGYPDTLPIPTTRLRAL